MGKDNKRKVKSMVGRETRTKAKSNEETEASQDHKAEKDYKAKAVIIGGGNSVKRVLADKKLYDNLHKCTLFGCNKAVKYFDCDYFVFYDKKFQEMNTDLIESFKGEIYAPGGVQTVRHDKVKYVKSTGKLSYRLDALYTANNCGVTALSLAIALGFKEIYLLGMDCRFSGGRTHFHDDYNREAESEAEATYDAFATFFEAVGKDIAKRDDIKVFNCSYWSLVDIKGQYFKWFNIRDIFNGRES